MEEPRLQLLDLPTEILVAVLHTVPVLDAVRCRRVCKTFLHIIDSSSVLQYLIELYLAAFVDGPPENTSPTAERLRLLRHQQLAWQELNWQRMDTYNVERQAPTYELYGGVYAQGLSAPWGGDPGITRGLRLIEFPSAVRGSTTDHTWTIEDFGFDVKDFGMDPSQDLLILMETPSIPSPADPIPALNVHLLALRRTSNSPHPLADVPILTWQPSEYRSSYSYWIQVVGDLLAVLFRPSGTPQLLEQPNRGLPLDELVIWNWRTGTQRSRLRFRDRAVRSFNFLSEDTFLVPATFDDTLAKLCVYQLPQSQSDSTPTLLAEYDIPGIKQNCLACSIICRSDPAPWAPVSRNPLQHDRLHTGSSFGQDPVYRPSHPKPFGPAPGSHLIVLSIWMIISISVDGQLGPVRIESRSYVAFVKAETLLTTWKNQPRPPKEVGDDQQSSTVTVPWQEWGPSNSRWLYEASDHSWVCFTYGQRYARLTRDIHGVVRLRVLDFNSIPFQKELMESKRAQDGQSEDQSEGQDADSLRGSGSHWPEIADLEAIADEPEHLPPDNMMTTLEEDAPDEGGSEADEDAQDEDAQDETYPEADEEGEDLEKVHPGFSGLSFSSRPNRQLSVYSAVIAGITQIVDDDVFEEPLVTSLPYRRTFSLLPEFGRLARVMMDDERIIGLRRETDPAHDQVQSMTIDVFTM